MKYENTVRRLDFETRPQSTVQYSADARGKSGRPACMISTSARTSSGTTLPPRSPRSGVAAAGAEAAATANDRAERLDQRHVASLVYAVCV